MTYSLLFKNLELLKNCWEEGGCWVKAQEWSSEDLGCTPHTAIGLLGDLGQVIYCLFVSVTFLWNGNKLLPHRHLERLNSLISVKQWAPQMEAATSANMIAISSTHFHTKFYTHLFSRSQVLEITKHLDCYVACSETATVLKYQTPKLQCKRCIHVCTRFTQ